MIALKQRARQLPNEGMEWPKPSFSAIAEGFGVKGFKVDTVEQYQVALRAAHDHNDPSLIDVNVDPSSYLGQITALRD